MPALHVSSNFQHRAPATAAAALPPSSGRAGRRRSYIIHLDHGIGIYGGVDAIAAGESPPRFGRRNDKDDEVRCNVPLYRLDQLERYRAAGEDGDQPAAAGLHRLGGGLVAAGAREDPGRDPADGSRELLDLYARRTVSSGSSNSTVQREKGRRLSVRGHARPAQGHPGGQGRHRSARPEIDRCWWATSAMARPMHQCARRFRQTPGAEQSRPWCRPVSSRAARAESLPPSAWPLLPVHESGVLLALPEQPRSRSSAERA